jgi:DNA polymerase-3 subunit delta
MTLQEIQKLKMAYPNGNIDIEDYIQQLGQQSQYHSVFPASISNNMRSSSMTFRLSTPLIERSIRQDAYATWGNGYYL